MSLITRYAVPLDLIPLQRLAVAAFTHAYAEFNTEENMTAYLSEHFSEEQLLHEIESGQVLIGLHEEKMVAYAKLVAPDSIQIPDRHPLEIARLYTDTNFIGRGIGKRMLKAIDEEAGKRGYDSVCLGVWQKNFRAINFYQREGFRIVGLTKFVLGDDPQDDFVMLRPLGN
jgi:ribosomal protein S18 acetylase RimI-like enzyme